MLRLVPQIFAWSAVLGLLSACNSKDDSGEDPDVTGGIDTDDGDDDTTEPTTTDTGFPPGDVGSLMLVEDQQRGLGLYAMFVNQHPGYENLAYCAVTDTVCLNGFPPDTDLGYPFDAALRFDPLFSQYRYVGDTITLGPYVADLYYDSERGLAFYYADLDSYDPLLGPVGVSFGAQWGEYEGTSDLVLREPLEIVVPRENGMLRATNASTISVEWIPAEGEDEIHLFATTGDPFFYAVQWTLEDDGYFEVPVDEILLGGIDPDLIHFTLQRWNTGTVNFRGHTLELVQLSDVEFQSAYDYVGSRAEVVPADNCAQAVNMVSPIAGPGSYSLWGRMTGFGTDLNNQCGLFSVGAEGLIRIDLDPLTAFRVEYNLPLGSNQANAAQRDAAVWVTDDCSDGNACLVGSDVNGNYLSEAVAYFNPSSTESETVYLVLGGLDAANDIFWLDVVVEQLQDPMMVDECLEAQQAVGIGEGSYYSEETAYLGTLDPGVACTNSQTPGPDAITKVVLQAGETLTVDISMPGADPAIYLMYNCTAPNTCLPGMGADTNLGVAETLFYENLAVGEEILYLVVDTKGGALQPYSLTLTVEP